MAARMTRLRFWLAVLSLAATPLTQSQAASESMHDAARREGEVVYYASMNLAEANGVISAFEKRSPFIKVKLNRVGSEKLLTRVLTEARAKKFFADVIQTVEFSMYLFTRHGA